MSQARIIGTGSSTPKRIRSNKDLESIVDTSDEWITRRSGIKERRIAQAREYLTKALEIFERLGTLIEPDKVREELDELPEV